MLNSDSDGKAGPFVVLLSFPGWPLSESVDVVSLDELIALIGRKS